MAEVIFFQKKSNLTLRSLLKHSGSKWPEQINNSFGSNFSLFFAIHKSSGWSVFTTRGTVWHNSMIILLLIIKFLLMISSYLLSYWFICVFKFYDFEINSLFKHLLLIGFLNTFSSQILLGKKSKWVVYYIKFWEF